VKRICVNGVERDTVDPQNFKIELEQDELGAHVLVELEPAGA